MMFWFITLLYYFTITNLVDTHFLEKEKEQKKEEEETTYRK